MIVGNSTSNNSSTPHSGARFSGPVKTDETAKPNRKQLEDLSKVEGKTTSQIIQERIQVPRLLVKLSNFGMNSASWILKATGIVGAVLSFLSYFVLNLKSLAVLFGIPTAGLFWMSYHLKRSLQDSDSDQALDPIKGLRNFIQESKLNQDADKTMMMRYIFETKKLLQSPEQGAEAKDLLITLKSMVDSKLDEMSKLEDFREDKELIEFYKDLEDYKAELEGVNDIVTSTVTVPQDKHNLNIDRTYSSAV